MRIEDMFLKQIDRDIKGVIKVGQDDEENVYQELEEYVITRELSKHFREFFENYSKGIDGHTDKMGVWISGFFGSGKSHFLKILSYLLENKEVKGRRAADFFTDGSKIDDPKVIENIKLAESVSTDVVLFNIDSKSEAAWKSSKDAIINVFVKVFNEMQGFCGSIPFIAELERNLVSEGRYDSFKQKFQEISGTAWEDTREEFYFIQDEIIETLTSLEIMGAESARNWCEKASDTYTISIEKFANLVKKYCESKGQEHHIVFLVDEIGQYIADDSDLLLNLQTVTEDLGTACGGKAWIIVTSQQDIDSIVKVRGNDFSKIQGRFDTRLSLSSANVDEVIRKRILAKSDKAKYELGAFYDEKEAIIKNLITFTHGIDMKVYKDRDEFSDVYPFVPYQFNLLGYVLTAIRTHGASGKHLAEGERSMIALFKDSAEMFKDESKGFLIPFNAFYNVLSKFIDHTHSVVISQADENSKLESFDVEVLKVLFMIKYVKEVKSNVDNITTLMISDVDSDRVELRKKVEKSLTRLVIQTLIQKNGELYTFLTNEEQDINKAIQNETVEVGEVINEASSILFEEIISESKYRYSPRYNFSYSQIMDDRCFKGKSSDVIGVKVITPYSDTEHSGETLRMLSASENNIIVDISNDGTFLEEIRDALKIEKFINKQGGTLAKSFESIKRSKQDELSEMKSRTRLYIEDAVRNADIYANGDRVNISSKDPSSRINEALGKLVGKVYSKLTYMETAPTIFDIESIFNENNQTEIEGLGESVKDKLALDDILNSIELSSMRHMKITMKEIIDRFSNQPYGFVDLDVQYLVARLFKRGDVSLTLNSKNISIVEEDIKSIVKYLTHRDYTSKLLIEKRERATDRQKKSAKEVMKDVFNINNLGEEDDTLIKKFKEASDIKIRHIENFLVEYRIEERFPGKDTLEEAKELLEEIVEISSPIEFFKAIDKQRDDLLDIAEDIEPIIDFFEGNQKDIVKKAWEYVDIFEASKTYIVDEELIDTVSKIEAIIKNRSPYREIYKLNDLLDIFENKHLDLLEEESKPVNQAIESDKGTIMEILAEKDLEDQFKERFEKSFIALKEKSLSSNKIADVKNIRHESEALRERCLNEIKKEEERRKSLEPKEETRVGEAPGPEIVTVVEKTVYLKSMKIDNIVNIETESDIEEFITSIKRELLDELKSSTNTKIKLLI